jgi:hypothetical protein
MKQHATARLAALGLVLSLMACQAPVAAPAPAAPAMPATPATPATPPDEAAALLAQIRAEIGEAPCSSHAQCRTLPIGSRACGGPASWWAWSTANASAERLQGWAQQLEQVERDRQARQGLMSTCVVVPDPGASCVAQRCVLNARGGVR